MVPLDWGLGHSTRCIPLINYLNLIGCDVIIAAEGLQQALLQAELPHLQFAKLRGYRITFSTNRRKTLLKIIFQIPKILIAINYENRWLKQFLLLNKIGLVISDNRYGLYNKQVKSVFITHQLSIKTPFGKLFERMLRKINYHFINKFRECWIPDYDGKQNMGGELSHPPRMPLIPIRYLGRLSRIVGEQSASPQNSLLVMLSGPEPQRSIFEDKLLSQLKLLTIPVILVRGLPGKKGLPEHTSENLVIFNHLPAAALNESINKAGIIISRSGYSTVMDLIGLKKKIIFVPTPGQAEQEYLARYLSSRKYCLMYKQQHFNVEKAMAEARTFVFEEFEEPAKPAYQDLISGIIQKLQDVE